MPFDLAVLHRLNYLPKLLVAGLPRISPALFRSRVVPTKLPVRTLSSVPSAMTYRERAAKTFGPEDFTARTWWKESIVYQVSVDRNERSKCSPKSYRYIPLRLWTRMEMDGVTSKG